MRQSPIIGFLTLTWACGSTSPPVPSGLFTNQVKELTLEVDYAPGAEPYTVPERPVPSDRSVWSLFQANAQRLFAGAPKTLHFPTRIEEMQALPDVGGPEYTVSRILEISAAHRNVAPTDTAASFHVLFLPGYFADDNGRAADVLGVSIGDTGVLAMFKPVIESTAQGGRPGPTTFFVEQSTLVHEFAHAAGLVNNGVPTAAAHQDEPHGAHCSNPACVMYWAHEGKSEMLDFVRQFVTSQDAVLFDDACLADVAAASAAQ